MIDSREIGVGIEIGDDRHEDDAVVGCCDLLGGPQLERRGNIERGVDAVDASIDVTGNEGDVVTAERVLGADLGAHEAGSGDGDVHDEDP